MHTALNRRHWRFATSALVGLVFVGTAFAQVRPARVIGTVSDSSGAAVGRATVILSTSDGRTEAITTSGDAGAYVFTGLRTGSYVLQVFAVGFGPSRMTNAQLEGGT